MKKKILSRNDKVKCLALAAQNCEVKSRVKGIDLADKTKLLAQAKNLRDEAERFLFGLFVFKDQYHTHTTGNQAPIID